MTAVPSTESVDTLLEQLLNERGDRLFDDPRQCRGILSDLLGPRGRQGREEARLLIAAVEGDVVPELAKGPPRDGADRSRLTKKLVDGRGLTPEQASWALDAWSRAFARRAGLPTDGGVGPPPGLGTEPPAPGPIPEPVPPRREDPREPGAPPRESSSGTLPPPPPTGPPSEPLYAPPPPPTRRRKRGGVLALVALLVLVGGGIAVGAVVASQDDEDDDYVYDGPSYSPNTTSYYSTTAPPTTAAPRPTARRYSVQNACLTGTACTVATFSGPGTTYSRVGRAANGDVVTVVCQTRGQMTYTDDPRVPDTDVWNKLADGSWISDMFVYTGHDGFAPELARC